MKRVTLKDIGKRNLIISVPKIVEIEGHEVQAVLKMEYELDFGAGVASGSTCLVYHAYKIVESSGTFLKQKVILKEFYPKLENEGAVISRREDGSLEVSEDVKELDSYRMKLEQFKKSGELVLKLHNKKETNNYVLNLNELKPIEANGTWYLIIDYNEACTLAEYIEKKPDLYEFLQVLKRVAEAISVLHEAEYMHLDLTLENLMVFKDGAVRLLDTDSFLKIDEIRDKRPNLSLTKGYSAPELFGVLPGEMSPRAHRRLLRFPERSDIFSIGAILYRYLYGECFEESICEKSLEAKVEEKYALNQEEIVKCPQNAMRIIKEFISVTLAKEMRHRYETMKEVEEILEELLPLVEPKRIQLLDNFRKNTNHVYGREEKLEELENLLTEQGQRGKHRLVLIHGIGGIGKSTLARAYAEKHLEQYDVIVEVAAESAEEIIKKIGIVNFENDNLEERIHILQRIMQEKKCLLIVHDYNQRVDDTFTLFQNLSCDVILTSWADWKESGIPCVALKRYDLTEDAAILIFQDIYLRNAQSDSQKLERMLESERYELQQLLYQTEYHPLLIKLLAKQMSYLAGAEQRPSQMLKELEQVGISENQEITFQNQKDGGSVELGNVFFHLQKIYGAALQNERLTEMELKVLRYMMLIAGDNGVCVGRLISWSGLGDCVGKTLTDLYKKGWIEFEFWKKDFLWNELSGEDADGIYRIPMGILQVLYRQTQFKTTVENSLELFEKIYDVLKVELKKYNSTKHLLDAEKGLCYYVEEELSERYALMLDICAADAIRLEVSRERRERLVKYVERAFEIRQNLAERNEAGIYNSYVRLIGSYYRVKRYKEAMHFCKKALEFSENIFWEKEHKSRIYGWMGKICLAMGMYEEALNYAEKSYDIKEQGILGVGHADKIQIYWDFGDVAAAEGSYFVAIDCYEDAIEMRRQRFLGILEEKLTFDDAVLAHALGRCYWKCGWRSRAIDEMRRALQIFEEFYGDKVNLKIRQELEECEREFAEQKEDVSEVCNWCCYQLWNGTIDQQKRALRDLPELRETLKWSKRLEVSCTLTAYRMKRMMQNGYNKMNERKIAKLMEKDLI